MKAAPILVYGASGHGKVVADAALVGGAIVLGFADDAPEKRGATLLGRSVVAAGLEEVAEFVRREGAHVALGIGANAARRTLAQRLETAGISLATVVHPSVAISPSVILGPGTVVMAQAAVNPDTRLGRAVIVNTSASVDHDSVIGDFAHLSPGVHLGGTVRVGTGTHLGVGASVRNNLTIGDWAVVGAGAVVVADVPDRVVCYGVPARVARRIEP